MKKINMKKTFPCITFALTALIFPHITFAQWNGTGTATAIYREGNVGVGTSAAPLEALEVGGYDRVNIRVGRWATLGIIGSHLSTVLGNNVKASATNNNMEILTTTVDGAKAIKMQYNEGIAFHTFQGSVTAGSAFSSERMRIDNNGNVGINTNSPSPDNKLHVVGRIAAQNEGVYATGDKGSVILAAHTGYYNKPSIYSITTAGVANDLLINPAGGNVGIGTGATSPDAKLTVKGDIHTREVKVDLNGAVGPDYVFEKDYDLLPLSELEAYITQNKHLPEVPSAKEMEANGLNLKEMNLLLLKKVEELTLHLIEMKKENDLQKEANALQQKEIDILKNKISER